MRQILLAAAIYNLLWGAWVVLFPLAAFRWAGMEPPRYPEIWQCVGMIVGVYGVGYGIAAFGPLRHWPIVLVGLPGQASRPARDGAGDLDRTPAEGGGVDMRHQRLDLVGAVRLDPLASPPGWANDLAAAAAADFMILPPFLEDPLRAPAVRKLAGLLAPMTDAQLERLASESATVTRRNFGKTIRLFAPLYVSNECVNSCTYCGFSRENAILRVTLSRDAMLREARHLAAEGFRNILVVAGEHPKFVSSGYLEDCVRALAAEVPGISLEVAPMEAAEYARMVAAGAEGLLVYQETYEPEAYAQLHRAGPKKDFLWRLACPERAYEGGFRRIGLGALFGLREDWKAEALALAAHLDHCLRKCWKAQFTVSLPRMRPCAGEWQPKVELADRDFIQLLCAFRLCFPQVGMVLSTREPALLRDAILPLGITMMSAGSHTEPGGYTGAGREDLHLTVKNKFIPAEGSAATKQFEIADERTPAEIAALLRGRGFDPVWKDWDRAILAAE